MRARSTEWQLFSDFLHRLYSSRDVGELSRQIATGLPSLIPADISTYNAYSDRDHRVDFVVEPAEADFPESRERLARHLRDNPLTDYYLNHPDGSAKRLSDFLSARQLHDSAVYSDFYRIPRVEHVLTAHIATRPHAQMIVGLCRTKGIDFSERDVHLLDLLDPHLAQAYQCAEEFEKIRSEMELLHRSLDQLGRGIVLARPDGSIQLETTEARRLLRHYFRDYYRDGRLPESLRSWLAQHQASGNRSPEFPGEPFIMHREEASLLVRNLRQDGPAMLLLEERRARLPPRSLDRLGITRREADVLSWVAEGKSDSDIATILGISFRTVKKHLEHVYAKLGVENRTAAAAIAHDAARAH